MRRLLLLSGLVLWLCPLRLWAAPPSTCSVGQGYYDLTTSTATFYVCTAPNTWAQVGATGSGVAWGQITGTLASQSDLQTALGLALAKASNLSDLANVTTARTNLGLGTAATTAATAYATAAQGATADSAAQKAANLSDLASAATARTNLGLGSLATQSGTFSGTASGTNTGDQTSVTGNAGTATALATARAINGVNFDGTAPITITAAGSTLSDTVTVAKGGTGLTTLTAHALYVGNGTSAPAALAVCGTGTYVRGAAGADPVCSTLTLPNSATAGDTLIATGANAVGAVTAVAAGGYFRSAGTSTAPIWSTLILPNTATAGTYLIATTSNTVIAVAPALTHSTPANQTGNATTTLKMNGLACAITPVATGRVVFTITGQRTQTVTADGHVIKMAFGTGTAPANAAAVTGTVISATQTWTALTGQLTNGFALTASTTGLALNTAVWFDLQIAEVTAGTAAVTNIDCTAHEI